ncbi:hypothetical protein FGO68_gene1577 [Halteria grandinella]|uniref:Uncharacterized protein n=1 Tax=Halteria grandinella TaxID=5974 RepID=A0A8J8P4T7_HALGN|nr:hypothetical protein FGO68_gene1577 [Halteria grandinella]
MRLPPIITVPCLSTQGFTCPSPKRLPKLSPAAPILLVSQCLKIRIVFFEANLDPISWLLFIGRFATELVLNEPKF